MRPNDDFEHILLATEKKRKYFLIVNRNKKKMMGYSLIDSEIISLT
jgi:hypothetical protein